MTRTGATAAGYGRPLAALVYVHQRRALEPAPRWGGPWHTWPMRPRREASPALPGLPLLFATLVFVGCPPDPPTCQTQVPACPDPPPSYVGEVNAIIQTYCVGCHGP